MKSTFFERTIAYFIDALIVSILLSIVCMGLPKKDSNIEEKLSELTTMYTQNEITSNDYLNEYSKLLFTSHQDNMIETGISLVLTIAYFVVFQYLNKGQTIGKKLMKIRVVDKDTNEPPTLIKGFIRSLVTLNIAANIVSLITINFLGYKDYLVLYMTLSFIQIIFLLVSILMIVSKNKGRGLHDMMANTKVIKEGR